MQNYKMWIDGKWVDAESGNTYTVLNPATEEEIARVPLGGQADVDKAVAAARKAFPAWSQKPLSERAEIMEQIASALKKRAQEFIEIDILDHGTPATLADMIVLGGAGFFEWSARTSKEVSGTILSSVSNSMVQILREPVGVCALITPWNIPLMSVISKMAPAMVMGNTCVIKPPTVDSLSGLKLAEILEQLDIPPGAVNIVTGPGGSVGQALTSHPDVSLVSFTGSSETGKAIMAAASGTVKRLQLELGGKNPVIVLDDANIDKAAQFSAMRQFNNSGQICASPGRYYLHEKIYDEFLEKFVAGARSFIVGDPKDTATQMGPVVSAEHRDSIEAFIKSGVEEGAELVLGGIRPTEPPLNLGYYVMPTVFTQVGQNMKIAREEIFGPVACIMEPFSSEDKVIELANDNKYGLCAMVWSNDTGKVLRFASALCTGTVWANDNYGLAPEPDHPWGGVKESGFGKEFGVFGLEDYTNMKVVALDFKKPV